MSVGPGNQEDLLEGACKYCESLPRFIFESLVSDLDHNKTEQSWTVQGFEKGAVQGCRLCVLISNGFRNRVPEFPEFRYWFEALNKKYDEVDLIGKLCVWTVTLQGVEVCHFELKTSRSFGDIQMPIDYVVDSKTAVGKAQKWISECVEKHECVNKDAESGWMPTRLLDLGRKQKAQTVQLITRDDVKTTDRRYTALSHCWGPDSAAVPRTLLKNLDARRAEIEIENLTKSFQDFLIFTQDLGIRYAWIDSLCIIQDSRQDFEIECAQMCDVYSQAYCTISASDANDGRGGCFMPRETPDIEAVQLHFVDSDTVEQNPTAESYSATCMVKIYPVLPSFARAITGPLSGRGWTLQERELSPRIIHFTKNRILWECRKCIATEEHPEQKDKIQVLATEDDFGTSPLRMMDGINEARDGHPKAITHGRWQSLKKKYSRQRLTNKNERLSTISGVAVKFSRLLQSFTKPIPKMTEEPSNEKCGHYTALLNARWQSLVEEYSRRRLTNKDDRLPAISGLATRFSRLTNASTYLAGIWEEGLTRGLCWIPTSFERVPTQEWPPPIVYPGIPSWSWAAFDGPIMFFSDDCQGDYPNVGRGKDAPFTHKKGLDPFGSVSGGAICLSGMAIEVVVSEEDYQPAVQDYQPAGSAIEFSSSESAELLFVDQPRRRHHDPSAAGVRVYVRPAGSASAPDFRTKKFRNTLACPPKRYILEKNSFLAIRMCLYFDVDPGELPPTKLLCLQTNSGKFPWPFSGIPTRNGLVLLQTGKREYRRVGLFLVERYDPVWGKKGTLTKVSIV